MTDTRITIATVRKNARHAIRLDIGSTENGPRMFMDLVRQHDGRWVTVRCLGQYRPDALTALANGIREAERMMEARP